VRFDPGELPARSVLVTPQVQAEMVGGIPLVTVVGTPRAMGEHLGERLRPRLHMLSQYLLEQILALPSTGGAAARIGPQAWMEIESMARGADLPINDLMIIHGCADIFAGQGSGILPGASTYAGLPAERSDSGRGRAALGWHLDPALAPYATLVRRVPAHGPASLTLTLAGLHPVAGLSEAGVAVASNALGAVDGGGDLLTTQIVAACLAAPSFEDCVERCQAVPRRGGRAMHLLGADGRRATVEMSGKQTARLTDPRPDAPRIHTDHAIDPAVRDMAPGRDPRSRDRLGSVASRALGTTHATPAGIAAWLGLAGNDDEQQASRQVGAPPESTVVFIAEPAGKQVWVKRGGGGHALDAVGL
jgi:hypothetical protein